jgi:hypothetical protein
MKKIIRKWLGVDKLESEEILFEMRDIKRDVEQLSPDEILKKMDFFTTNAREEYSKYRELVETINSHPINLTDLIVFIFDEMVALKEEEYDWRVKKFYTKRSCDPITMNDFVREVFAFKHNDVVVEEIVRKINSLQLNKYES